MRRDCTPHSGAASAFCLSAGDVFVPLALYNDIAGIYPTGVIAVKKDTCCFTGHRNIRKEDEGKIREKIREQVLALMAFGITDYMVGGAMGFDMLAAEVLTDLREKEGKELKIISALPFLQWRAKWPQDAMEREDRILEKSDEILISSDKYSRRSYLDRDRVMVDRSAVCIAYCSRKTGGTAYTVRYALRQGVKVHNIADWDAAQLLKDDEEKPLVFK